MTGHEKAVIKLRFGMCGGYARTLEEVGTILNISTERVRHLEESALRKLQSFERGEYLHDLMMCVSTR